MRNALVKNFKRLIRCEEGVTLVEYGIAITLAVGVGVGALTGLAGAINTQMGDATTCMNGGGTCP